MGILLFLFRLGARRRLDYALRSRQAAENLNLLAGTSGLPRPRSQTLTNLLRRLPVGDLRTLPAHMVRGLRSKKVLHKFRLRGIYHRIAIDATGFLSFRQRHCENCLTREYPDGTVIYHHPVLEAKLILGDEAAVSVASEFIQNTDGQDKQDCELAAFQRLAARIREEFPCLPTCLLLDAQYMCEPVMSLCRKHDFRYIITFKEGSMPERWAEFQNLLGLGSENTLRTEDPEGTVRLYRWAEDIPHQGHRFNAVQMEETDQEGQTTRFAWATDLRIDKNKVRELCLRGGRARWKIENRGFGRQKQRGFALEHPYCEDWQGQRNYYFLMQIADAISQLIEASNLLGEEPEKLFGSRMAFALRLLEAWRTLALRRADLRPVRRGGYQVRIRGP